MLQARGKTLEDLDHPLDNPVKFQLSLFGSPNLIVFDVGGCIGSITAEYKSILESCNKEADFRIYCCEPLPLAFERLRAEFQVDPSVICENLALSDCNGEANFYQGSLPYTISLLPLSKEIQDNAWGETTRIETK